MTIKTTIEDLRREKSSLSSRIFNIDQEIYLLQLQCAHSLEDLDYREPRTLEPRWSYERAYSYDKQGDRIIQSRSANCTVCGKSWTEMRFTDSEWMESNDWEESARKSLSN